jgi:hypothetical protein
MHVQRLFGEVVAGIRIIWVQALHNLEHLACCPVLFCLSLREIAQPMAPEAGNPPGPIQNTAPVITARAFEPKAPAAKVHTRSLEVHIGYVDLLTVVALTADLQPVASRE